MGSLDYISFKNEVEMFGFAVFMNNRYNVTTNSVWIIIQAEENNR